MQYLYFSFLPHFSLKKNLTPDWTYFFASHATLRAAPDQQTFGIFWDLS